MPKRCSPWRSRFLRDYPAEAISNWSGCWCPVDDCSCRGTCPSCRRVCRSSLPSLRRGTPRKPSLNATYVTNELTQWQELLCAETSDDLAASEENGNGNRATSLFALSITKLDFILVSRSRHKRFIRLRINRVRNIVPLLLSPIRAARK